MKCNSPSGFSIYDYVNLVFSSYGGYFAHMVKSINLEPFSQNFFCKFYKFAMGQAIFNKLLGWVDKTLKKINFSGKHSFSPFKSGFGSMTLKKTDINGSTASWH